MMSRFREPRRPSPPPGLETSAATAPNPAEGHDRRDHARRTKSCRFAGALNLGLLVSTALQVPTAAQSPPPTGRGTADPAEVAKLTVHTPARHVVSIRADGPTRLFVDADQPGLRLSVLDAAGAKLGVAADAGCTTFDRHTTGEVTVVVEAADAPTTLTIRSCPLAPARAAPIQELVAQAKAALANDRLIASRMLANAVRQLLDQPDLAGIADLVAVLVEICAVDDELLSAQKVVGYTRPAIQFYAAVAPRAHALAHLRHRRAEALLHLRRPADAYVELAAARAGLAGDRSAEATAVRRRLDLTQARACVQAGDARAALDLAGALPDAAADDHLAIGARLIHAVAATMNDAVQQARDLANQVRNDPRASASERLRADLILAQTRAGADDPEARIAALTEAVEQAERWLSPDSTWLAELRWSLALQLERSADRADQEHALELAESAVAVWTACPDASPFHVASRGHDLAQSLVQLRDYASARRVFATALEAYQAQTLRAETAAQREDLIRSLRLGIAYVDSRLDRWQESSDGVDQLLAQPANTPRQHLVRASAIQLRSTLLRLGDKPQEASRLVREALAELKGRIPAHIHQRLLAELAAGLYEAGDHDGAAEAEAEVRKISVEELIRTDPKYLRGADRGEHLADVLERALQAATDAVHRARTTCGTARLGETVKAACSELDDHFTLLTVLNKTAGHRVGSVERQLLELTEAIRMSRTAAQRIRRALRDAGPDLGDTVRQQVAALDAANAEIAKAYAEAPNSVLRCVRRRDEAEQRLVDLLAATGKLPPPERPTLAALASTLAPHEAAVAYWRYFHAEPLAGEGSSPVRWTHYVAFVVLPNGTLHCLPLGRSDVVERAGATFRAFEREARDQSAGATLRQALLDPVTDLLRRSGAVGASITTLRIAAEEEVGLVPFDSLPDGKGGQVGDRLTITFVPSLSDLARGSKKTAQPRLVTLAGVDFAALPEPLGAALRSGSDGKLRPLTQSSAEASRVEAAFREHHPRGSIIALRGARASKRALLSEMLGATHLHLATHAWFAPGWLQQRDPHSRAVHPIAELGQGPRQLDYLSLQSPLSLCGLAVSGADTENPQTRPHGVVTGEEIAGLDLGTCDLAVLSACCTSLGVYSPQGGVASFQKALHSAGVSNTITALWPVPDIETSELMGRFYVNLWTKKMTIVRALAAAKQSMRDEVGPDGRPRYEARIWAAFILSGRGD